MSAYLISVDFGLLWDYISVPSGLDYMLLVFNGNSALPGSALVR